MDSSYESQMSCIAVLCDPVGRIDRVLGDPGGCLPAGAAGTMLAGHLTGSSVPHFYHMLVELEERGALCEWLLGTRSPPPDGALVRVSAARCGRAILIAGQIDSHSDGQIDAGAGDFGDFLRQLADTERPDDMVTAELADRIAARVNDRDALMADLRLQARAFAAEMAAPQRLENELVRQAAHDLRNPLLVISMNCSYLLERAQGFSEDERELLSDSLEMCEFAGQFLGRIRQLAGFSVGQLAVEPMATDLSGLVRQLVERKAIAARSEGIAIALTRADAIAIAVDSDKLLYAIGELLANAVAFCPAGSTVEVSITAGESEVVVAVADDGPGIAPELRDNLFRPFARATSEPGQSGRAGAGVGLAIVRRIAEAHGGRVDVASEPGRGTRVAIALPASLVVTA